MNILRFVFLVVRRNAVRLREEYEQFVAARTFVADQRQPRLRVQRVVQDCAVCTKWRCFHRVADTEFRNPIEVTSSR